MPAHPRSRRTRRRAASSPPAGRPGDKAAAAPGVTAADANPLAAALSMLLANASAREEDGAACGDWSDPTVAATAATAAAAALLERHTLHMGELLGQARRIAQLMLDRMEQRLVAGEEVYPREFVHVCRGLQLLGKTGAELAKAAASRPAASASGADAAADGGDDDDCGLTPEQLELLEAEVRLWEAQRHAQAQAQDDAFRASHPGHALGDVRRPAAP